MKTISDYVPDKVGYLWIIRYSVNGEANKFTITAFTEESALEAALESISQWHEGGEKLELTIERFL